MKRNAFCNHLVARWKKGVRTIKFYESRYLHPSLCQSIPRDSFESIMKMPFRKTENLISSIVVFIATTWCREGKGGKHHLLIFCRSRKKKQEETFVDVISILGIKLSRYTHESRAINCEGGGESGLAFSLMRIYTFNEGLSLIRNGCAYLRQPQVDGNRLGYVKKSSIGRHR